MKHSTWRVLAETYCSILYTLPKGSLDGADVTVDHDDESIDIVWEDRGRRLEVFIQAEGISCFREWGSEWEDSDSSGFILASELLPKVAWVLEEPKEDSGE